jgi:hypothetical protein
VVAHVPGEEQCEQNAAQCKLCHADEIKSDFTPVPGKTTLKGYAKNSHGMAEASPGSNQDQKKECSPSPTLTVLN